MELFFENLRNFFVVKDRLNKCWKQNRDEHVDIEQILAIDAVENHTSATSSRVLQQMSLNGSVVTTIEELYAASTVAKSIFDAFLMDVMNHINATHSEQLKIAPLKAQTRAIEKAKDDYSAKYPGPNISWLFDIVRGAIICSSEEQINTVVSYILSLSHSDSAIEVIRLKNRFQTPTPAGFRDIFMNIRLQLSPHNNVFHICELQIHHQAIKDLGIQLHSHKYYEFFRMYFRGRTEAYAQKLELMSRLNHLICSSESIADYSTSMASMVDAAIQLGDVNDILRLASLLSDIGSKEYEDKLVRYLNENVEHLNSKGIRFLKKGEVHKAIACFEDELSALEITGGLLSYSGVRVLIDLADAFVEIGNYNSAMKSFSRAIDVFYEKMPEDDEDMDHSLYFDIHMGQVEMLRKQGNFTKAIVICKKLVEYITPEQEDYCSRFVQASSTFAELLIINKEYSSACEVYQKAIFVAERYYGAAHCSTMLLMVELANSYLVGCNDVDASIATLRQGMASLVAADNAHTNEGLSLPLALLVVLFQVTDRIDEGRSALEALIACCDRANNSVVQKKLHMKLHVFFEKIGQFRLAKQQLEIANQCSRQLLSKQSEQETCQDACGVPIAAASVSAAAVGDKLDGILADELRGIDLNATTESEEQDITSQMIQSFPLAIACDLDPSGHMLERHLILTQFNCDCCAVGDICGWRYCCRSCNIDICLHCYYCGAVKNDNHRDSPTCDDEEDEEQDYDDDNSDEDEYLY